MPHFPNFTTLPKIWLLTKLLFPSREGWFSDNTYQKNASVSASKFSNFVTRLGTHMTWNYTWGRTDSTARDSNPCDSDRTDEEDRRTWSQIIHGQFYFFTWIIWWLGEETDLLLWHSQAEQERHATRPKTEDNKTEKGRHSRKNQGWLDGRQYCGGTRETYAYWLIFTMPQRKVISVMKEEKP